MKSDKRFGRETTSHTSTRTKGRGLRISLSVFRK
jgi:hypothetical protein